MKSEKLAPSLATPETMPPSPHPSINSIMLLFTYFHSWVWNRKLFQLCVNILLLLKFVDLMLMQKLGQLGGMMFLLPAKEKGQKTSFDAYVFFYLKGTY